MKRLYLLRHAKSSWAEFGLADRDRPLSDRGRANAPAMGRRFAQRGETLDRILSSPATRARQTARAFAGACGFPADAIELNESLYFLGQGSIESVIEAQPDTVDTLMLVFHNPDITAFANSIGDDFRIDNVPTCGLLRLNCEVESWRSWSPDDCRFGYFDYPKNPNPEPIDA